jgi:hypothetical protein
MLPASWDRDIPYILDFRVPVRIWDPYLFQIVQIESGAHPASKAVGTGKSFSGSKVAVACKWPHISPGFRLKKSGALPPLPIHFRTVKKSSVTCYLTHKQIIIVRSLLSLYFIAFNAVFVNFICHRHWAGCCSSNIVDVCFGGSWSKSRPGDRLSWLRVFLVFLRSSSQMSGLDFDCTTTVSFQTIFESLITIIPLCSIQTAPEVIKARVRGENASRQSFRQSIS